jgi:peptidoglycan-associated lipoprotein
LLYLIGRGVSQSQIQTRSPGELDARGTDEEGWAADRKVEIALPN